MQDAVAIDQKFMRAEHELDLLRRKVHLKRGGWIFTSHVYGVDELLHSPHHRKVFAICEKIGDDVMGWQTNGKLTEMGIAAYQRGRNRIARGLRDVNREVEERQPTLCERWLAVFKEFGRLVLETLPTLARLLKVAVRLLVGEPTPRLLTEMTQSD